jgi:peptidoglycan/xylan/chitin deacetylase (PgdA/CDA1 family)
MRADLKIRLEKTLSSAMMGRMAHYRIRGKKLILAYHGIVPEGAPPAGERALFVGQREFGQQLDAIASVADVVPLDKLDQGSGARPRVAITFDDAYRGAVREGVRELVARRLPATIFVAPGLLNDHVFWWDRLAEGRSSLDDGIRNHALTRLRGDDDLVRVWAEKIRLPSSDRLPAYAQSATQAELHDALRHPGITVGSHSWSHANLAVLPPRELALEVERSLAWLQRTFGEKAIPWLAYPYGLDSDAAHKLAATAGYLGGVRISGGWHRAADVSPFARPRLNIPAGLSVDGFRARLLGVLRT